MTQVSPAGESNQIFYAILGEPIPQNTQLLRTAKEYRHFRWIYSAQRQLNELIRQSKLRAEVRLIMIDRTSDIPRKLWDLSNATCVIIFGPNFPWLSEATIRLWATASRDRLVVVCHDPKNALFSWDRLLEFSTDLNVKGYQASADDTETKTFWTNFFNDDLRPLIEVKTSQSAGSDEGRERVLSRREVNDVLAKDHEATDLLPGFPHICRKAIQAIDAHATHTAVAKIIAPDGALLASIVRTSNPGALRLQTAHRDIAQCPGHDRRGGDA